MTGPTPDERTQKRNRVCALLGADDRALWLSSPAAVSWYLSGARIHTSLAGPPIAGVLVGPEVEQVVTYRNEAERLISEELPTGIDVQTVDWHTPLSSGLPSTGIRTEQELEAPLRAARAALLPAEKARFENLCTDTARLLTRHLGSVRPEMTEWQLSAELSRGIVELGADPVVVMVAGDSRLGHRHPLSTEAPVGDRAMAVVCARRHGLIANITRWAQTRRPPAETLDAAQRLYAVESAFFTATRPGRSLDEVLQEGIRAYAAHGFSPDEWQNHHQGGAAGYAGRDPRAQPGSTDLVQDQQAFAWNPSAPGVKVEDTVILEQDRIRPLTVDPEWPTVTVNGLQRPTALQL